MKQSNHYQHLVHELKLCGVPLNLVHKTWAKRSPNLDEKQAIKWLKQELIIRGYVAEDIIVNIHEESDVTIEINNTTLFGRFTLHNEIGRGGMGKIYSAFDPNLNKEIALKILSLGSSEKIAKRFLTEGQILANLHHRNIVKFYEIGKCENQYYLTMDFIDGPNLREWFTTQKLSAQVNAFQKICTAVHEAHNNNIIHRDIKPENIMISKQQEPILLDFGIAKKRHIHFSTINVLGTPNYMSPEQTQGSKIDCRSDIFSLGILFYEMLTSRLPFVGKNDFEIFKSILFKEPISLRLLNPQIERELETICLKCLQKDPGQRYQSALEIYEDIERFKNHEVIVAKPTSKWQKAKKWAKRNKLTTIVSFIFMALIFFILNFYIISIQRFSKQSERTARQANIRIAKIAFSKAKRAYKNQQWQKSGVYAGSSLQSILNLDGKKVEQLRKHSKELVQLNLLQYSILWHKNIKKEIFNEKYRIKRSKNFSLYERKTGRKLFSINDSTKGHLTPYFSKDNTLLAFCDNKKIRVFDISLQKQIRVIPIKENAYKIKFSYNNQYLVFYNHRQSDICVWDIVKNRLLKTYNEKKDINAICFSNTNSLLAYSNHKTIVIADFHSGKTTIIGEHNNMISSLKFVNNNQIISATVQGVVKIWQINNQKQIFSVPEVGHTVAVSKSKEMFASCFYGNIFIWDMDLGRIIQRFEAPAGVWMDLKFTKDDKQILVISENDTTCFKIFYSKRLFKIKDVDAFSLLDINFDSSILACLESREKKVDLWGLDTYKKHFEILHPDIVTDIAFSKYQNVLFTTCLDNKLRLWQNNQVLASYKLESIARFMQPHPLDENIIAYASRNKLFLFNINTQKSRKIFESKTPIKGFVLSHDGTMFALTNTIETIVGDIVENKLLQRLSYAPDVEHPPRLDFSANNELLMVCNFHNIHFWNIREQKQEYQIGFPNGNSCIFSPYYKNFIYADFRYRLVNANYGYTIKDFYYGWVRTRAMVSSSQGFFAACLTDHIVVLKLPPLPNYTIKKLPSWHKEFPLSSKKIAKKSFFDLNSRVPGWFIESVLDESPQRLTELLFELRIKEDLTFYTSD
ncbi:protein kinase [Candidatus Uabimicrobium sp. HlEnr_7]|uniref:protein kinase domain-containing protein n=1 Tax=Candidatus Uabimicrobium helgolandensis TaxID=3095367 RepID=UPI003558B6B2